MYILNCYDDVINSSIWVYNWSVRLQYKALSWRYFPPKVNKPATEYGYYANEQVQRNSLVARPAAL